MISLGFVPLPLAILTILDPSIYFSPSSSYLVIESITYKNFLILSVDSFSWPLGIMFALKPGIMPTTFPRLPMFNTDWNWSLISLRVNFPALIYSIICFCYFSPIASYTVFISPAISPRPSNRRTKPLASNGSKSSKCSPVPRKIIGLSVAATALKEPPPFALPSNFVMMT